MVARATNAAIHPPPPPKVVTLFFGAVDRQLWRGPPLRQVEAVPRMAGQPANNNAVDKQTMINN